MREKIPFGALRAALTACIAAAVATAAAADAPPLVLTPFHADGIYALGETVGMDRDAGAR